MPFTFKQLTGNAQLSNSPTVRYAATNKKARIDKATAFNASGSPVTVDVWLVAGSATPADINKILEGKSVASNATVSLVELEGHVIDTNFSLQAQASASGAIALTVSGFEIT